MYGNKIRLIRLARGLSQDQTAKRIGILQNEYSKMENNHVKVSEEKILQLSIVFGVSIEDIKCMEPVIMNFRNIPSAEVNNEKTQGTNNEGILKSLQAQLDKKDEQITMLLEIVSKKQRTKKAAL